LSEQRKYRTFSVQKKLEIVLAGLRGDVSVKDLCRQHQIAETLYYSWREKLLEGGKTALAGKEERQGERELKRRIRDLERALVARRTSSRSRGKHCGAGSEGARVPVPRADREGPSARGRRARAPSEQERALSETEAAPDQRPWSCC
jgi:transposase-like protein